MSEKVFISKELRDAIFGFFSVLSCLSGLVNIHRLLKQEFPDVFFVEYFDHKE